jgi:hypothetical protein
MPTEMGEYIVGAYLRLIEHCDFIDYNVRSIEGGQKGLNEFDVLGLRFRDRTAYLCEVTTHIRGLLYKDNKATVERVKQKYQKQKEYAREFLKNFPNRHFMFWSPRVPEGYVTGGLRRIRGLELVINTDYTQCINKLRSKAHIMSNNVGNPFFRALQILERLRE